MVYDCLMFDGLFVLGRLVLCLVVCLLRGVVWCLVVCCLCVTVSHVLIGC